MSGWFGYKIGDDLPRKKGNLHNFSKLRIRAQKLGHFLFVGLGMGWRPREVGGGGGVKGDTDIVQRKCAFSHG